MKKIASAPRAGIDASIAGFECDQGKYGAISHGITRLNPFHKNANKVETPSTATAEKPPEQEKPKQEAAPAAEPPRTQLGERITIPENETNAESTAATEGAVTH